MEISCSLSEILYHNDLVEKVFDNGTQKGYFAFLPPFLEKLL